ncbi:MAG: ATP-dependent zinc metalloprotease FtsH, partial [Pseudonocardiaceae bacterium]
KDLERIFSQVEKRPRITAFNDFGGRTPSDKPPIKTAGELAKERGEPWPPARPEPRPEPQPNLVGNGAGPYPPVYAPAGEANGGPAGHPKPGPHQGGYPQYGPPNYGAPPGWRPATEPPAPVWQPPRHSAQDDDEADGQSGGSRPAERGYPDRA